jgi:hypothetical protein
MFLRNDGRIVHSSITQKTNIYIHISVNTLNLTIFRGVQRHNTEQFRDSTCRMGIGSTSNFDLEMDLIITTPEDV